MKPEAGRHPSNPVVERSWDAVFILLVKIVGANFEFFGECVYIMSIEHFKFKRYGNNN